MLSDKNGNLILVGTPQIRIPERMFFLAKNGQVREAPTTTKTGALSMRGGVRSINLIPDGDKVEIVKLGETLEEFRKRQSKKESEDFIKKVNETKINKKLDIGDMPELPEPKKEKEERIIILDDIEKLQDEYKNASRSEKANLTKQINEKKKYLKELDDKYDEYYYKISRIKDDFKELLRNEFLEPKNNIEQLNKLLKTTIDNVQNIINKMKKENINTNIISLQLKESYKNFNKTIENLEKKREKTKEPKIDYEEIAHNDYKNNNRFLSDWLDIERTNKESGILPEEMGFINVMYDLMDKQFKTDEVRKSFKKINFSQKAQEYIQDWIDKKKDGQTELSDFVKLVIFPALKKDNKDIDNLTLLLFGLQIATDFKQKIDLKWGASKSQFNSYRVWKIFNIVKGKITGVFPELKKLNGYTSAYSDWLDYREGPQASKKFK